MGPHLVVIDVRDAAAFGAWHIPVAGTSILNVPEADLAAERRRSRCRAGAAVRLICNAGNASLRARALLERLGDDVRSVHDGMIGWSRVLQFDDVPLTGPVSVSSSAARPAAASRTS